MTKICIFFSFLTHRSTSDIGSKVRIPESSGADQAQHHDQTPFAPGSRAPMSVGPLDQSAFHSGDKIGQIQLWEPYKLFWIEMEVWDIANKDDYLEKDCIRWGFSWCSWRSPPEDGLSLCKGSTSCILKYSSCSSTRKWPFLKVGCSSNVPDVLCSRTLNW